MRKVRAVPARPTYRHLYTFAVRKPTQKAAIYIFTSKSLGL